MRVLMLGWEFPPHISGGLGTACEGLTRGLASQGVEVLFVVPKRWGDESAGHMKLLGCEEVETPAAAPTALESLTPVTTAPADAAPRSLVASAAEVAPAADWTPESAQAASFTSVLTVDSPLTPYLDAASVG